MKMGRFEDSIAKYEQALAVDPNFVASYVGISNNRMFMGEMDETRAYSQSGNNEAARATCEQVVDFNQLNVNLAYIRGQAREMLESL